MADAASETDGTVSRLVEALARIAGFAGVRAADLEALPQHGIAHAHYRIGAVRRDGHAALLRAPLWSQFGLAAARNLGYQAACFERASPGGCSPRLWAHIAPSLALPMGALVVDAIDGAPVRLPRDLPAMADCFASVHRLGVPPAALRAPLADHQDPIAGTMGFIEAQAPFVAQSVEHPDAKAMIAEELAWAGDFAARCAGAAQPVTLALTDTHPGNFLVDAAGRAWFVDLEKALYGSPAIDLAHATIYTSTQWDVRARASLSRADIQGFYRHYLASLPAPVADALRPWLLPMRRLAWLRSTTWSCKWRIERRQRRARERTSGVPEGPAIGPALDAHIKDRLALFVAPETIARVRAEWRGPDPLELV